MVVLLYLLGELRHPGGFGHLAEKSLRCSWELLGSCVLCSEHRHVSCVVKVRDLAGRPVAAGGAQGAVCAQSDRPGRCPFLAEGKPALCLSEGIFSTGSLAPPVAVRETRFLRVCVCGVFA